MTEQIKRVVEDACVNVGLKTGQHELLADAPSKAIWRKIDALQYQIDILRSYL